MCNKYSEQGDTEFYSFINEKMEEIKALSVPKDTRDMLYKTVNETIERYKRNKASYISGIESSQKLLKTLESLASSSLNFDLKVKKLLFILEDNNNKSKDLLSKAKGLFFNSIGSKDTTPTYH